MNRLRSITLLLSPLICLGALYVVLTLTDPIEIGPGGVLGVFFLIYLCCLSICYVVLRFGIGWAVKLFSKRAKTVVPKTMNISVRRAYYVASIISFMPVILLAMHAFSQLRLTDVILVVVFAAFAIFYVMKRRSLS